MSDDAPQRSLLLTGASRGIGHATVKRFSEEGWRVLTCSRHPFPEDCPWPAGEEDHVQVDLADPRQTMEAVEEVKKRLKGGRLDALVNNAGISPKNDTGKRLTSLDTDLRDWGQVFHVNFFSAVVLARGLKDELALAKGAIVTSKAALASLTREMAHDFGPIGVRVNAVAPGEIETEILSPGTEKLAESLPMRRLGQPEEVAQTIYFLCSGKSSYISGVEIEINGAQHV